MVRIHRYHMPAFGIPGFFIALLVSFVPSVTLPAALAQEIERGTDATGEIRNEDGTWVVERSIDGSGPEGESNISGTTRYRRNDHGDTDVANDYTARGPKGNALRGQSMGEWRRTEDGAEFESTGRLTDDEGTELGQGKRKTTVTKNADGSYNYSVDRELTGKEGNQATIQRKGTVRRTDEGWKWQGESQVTGPGGKISTATSTGEAKRLEDGKWQWKRDTKGTGPEGHKWTASGEGKAATSEGGVDWQADRKVRGEKGHGWNSTTSGKWTGGKGKWRTHRKTTTQPVKP